ncbi:hypothetical protein EON82_17825 [bacterium]|nr:MAG: hypothetical protein EON82_17825 [bacterium]
MSANGRFAVASDPGHETAFPIPRVISQENQQELETELRIELADQGFTPRQATEVVHAFRGYAALTQEWNRQHQRALEAEETGEGFRSKAYELLAECRRTGAKIKDPKVLDRESIHKMRALAAAKHDKVTKKITGNWFVMACAVLLKAFLLLPLADGYLQAMLPDAQATRALAALLLASVLAYSLTFVARYLVQLGVGMFGPEEGQNHHRSVADILKPKANKTMFWIVFGLFVVVIGAFLSFDFANSSTNNAGLLGLSTLFVAILVVFELFLAYRLAVLQDPQPNSMESVDDIYIQALNRADNETDLAKLRTYATSAEESWHRFLTMLDAGFNWRRPRRKAMAIVRQTVGILAEANDRVHLNGKAVVRLEEATAPESLPS